MILTFDFWTIMIPTVGVVLGGAIFVLTQMQNDPRRASLHERVLGSMRARFRGTSNADVLARIGSEIGPSFRVADPHASPLLLSGDSGGRAVTVELFTTDSSSDEVDLRFRVAVKADLPPLELHRAVFHLAPTASWPPGVEVDAAHEASARDAVVALFGRLDLDRIRILDGEVRAAISWPRERLADVGTAVALLADVARALEPALRLAVKVGDPAAHPDAHVRCAYCHDELLSSETDTRKCERCGTVLHAGCREELGRCPVLGCSGRVPEGARTQ